jgi:hypothetical protein
MADRIRRSCCSDEGAVVDCQQKRWLIVVLLVGLMASHDVRGQADDAPLGEKNAYAFRALTVQIRSAKTSAPDTPEAEGYGFVVGRRGDVLTIVTADHVVRDSDEVLYDTVTVDFFIGRGHPLPAKILTFRIPRQSGDMAVLEVNWPDFPGMPDVLVAPLPISEGTRAWRIGKARGWTPSINPGAFVGMQLGIWLGFDNLDAPRGSSGGPVLTNGGLIGMVVSDESGQGNVLPITTITDFITQQGAPWDLPDPRKGPAPDPVPPEFAGVDILYFPKAADEGLVADAFSAIGIKYREGTPEGFDPSNVVSCTPDVPIEAVRKVAIALINKGVKLRGIAPQTWPGVRMRITVENYWTYVEKPLLTTEDIDNIDRCPNFNSLP